MKDENIIECLGYQSSQEQTMVDPPYLVIGSQNVLVDYQKKVRIRNGVSRLGVANTAATPTRAAIVWGNSTGGELPVSVFDTNLVVYLGTVDTVALNDFYNIKTDLTSTEIPRFTLWWDTVENLDELLFVQGNANIYEWDGGVAVVDSITGTTITKKGTTTFAQNRFYTAANKTLICERTGTEYTYTGGETTTTLTGIADTTGLIAGDVLIQKVVTNTNKPAASRNNHTIFSHENQIYVGSEDDNEVYISQNDDYADFTFSTPRTYGEGALLALTGISRGFGAISNIPVIFCGKSDLFKVEFEQDTVSTTLSESLKIKKLKSGVNQSAQTPESIVSVGNAVIYLSFEPAVRILEQPESIEGPQLKTLSYPIKPDMDAETWTNANAIWWKNAYFLSAPSNSRYYILEFMEDADGKLRRFWQPPQVGGYRAFGIIDNWLHGFSNATPEVFKLLDSTNEKLSDLVYNSSSVADEKVPINAIAKFSYRSFGKKKDLKIFDEFFIEGEITPNSDITATLKYDFNGATQEIEETIDGGDEDILIGAPIQASLGQISLGQNNLGGALKTPENARKFRVVFEEAREDFNEIQFVFSSNEIDYYWAILAHGINAELSRRRNTIIYK